MERKRVNSSKLRSVGYDEKTRTIDEVVQALNDAADDWDRLHPTGGAR